MSSSRAAMSLLLLVFAVLLAATIRSEAASAVDCSSVVLSMADCLSYVTNGSKTEKPEGGCCSGLKQVLKTNPACLCQAFQQSAQFGIVLNVTKALALPSACHVHAPSATKCAMSLAMAPAGAPAGGVLAPAGAPSMTNPSSAGGVGSSKITPAAAPSNGGSSSSIIVSINFIIAGIVTVFFTFF